MRPNGAAPLFSENRFQAQIVAIQTFLRLVKRVALREFSLYPLHVRIRQKLRMGVATPAMITYHNVSLAWEKLPFQGPLNWGGCAA